jgi:hypothetical protein
MSLCISDRPNLVLKLVVIHLRAAVQCRACLDDDSALKSKAFSSKDAKEGLSYDVGLIC